MSCPVARIDSSYLDLITGPLFPIQLLFEDLELLILGDLFVVSRSPSKKKNQAMEGTITVSETVLQLRSPNVGSNPSASVRMM